MPHLFNTTSVRHARPQSHQLRAAIPRWTIDRAKEKSMQKKKKAIVFFFSTSTMRSLFSPRAMRSKQFYQYDDDQSKNNDRKRTLTNRLCRHRPRLKLPHQKQPRRKRIWHKRSFRKGPLHRVANLPYVLFSPIQPRFWGLVPVPRQVNHFLPEFNFTVGLPERAKIFVRECTVISP